MPLIDEETLAARRKFFPLKDVLVDVKNPDIYANSDYHEIFAQLRAQQPIYWNPESGSAGFWAVTKYDDVVRVVQDPEVFSAAVENGGMRIFNAQDVSINPRPHLLSMDPPQHTQLRRALQPMFAPARVAALQDTTRRRMTALLDGIAESGHAEFVSAVAGPFALGLLTDLLDVPEADAAQLQRWSDAFVGDDDQDYQESTRYRMQCVTDMDAYALQLLSERRGSDREDFVTLMSRAQIDGRPIDNETYSQNFGAFLIAGNESTRHTLARGIIALSLFPEEKLKLLADRSLIGSAVKEITRWATPLMHVRRTAMKDVLLNGQLIKKGDKVVLWYNSANRDEQKWHDSTRFDVARFADRAACPHLAFGNGPHHCLGWRMAELQLTIALEELLERLPDLRAIQPARFLRSNFIAGVKTLPVAFTPERGPRAMATARQTNRAASEAKVGK